MKAWNPGKQKDPAKMRFNIHPLILLAVGIFILLICIENFALTANNRQSSYRTEEMMIDQIESIMENNEVKTDTLTESLKESYITKAKAIAYIIDHVPKTDTNRKELKTIADLIAVDEIHVFDDKGKIYSGTVPEYYGYSFDSGEQMAFFKPMLKDKKLSMCQDVTPNTAEGKSIMYAICWNGSGDKMIQVGIEPIRLLRELHANEVSELLSDTPLSEGMTIFITESGAEGEIVGSSGGFYVGKTLAELGIEPELLEDSDGSGFTAVLEGEKVYCMASKIKDDVILITQEADVVNRSIPLFLLATLLYLILAAIVMGLIIRRMTVRLLDEHRNASTDQLTGVPNRRSYEDDLKLLEKDPKRDSLVCLSLDLNGLKMVNDSQGHEAGDTFIRVAADLMQKSFSPYGQVYRIGGDEFAALLHLDSQQQDQLKENFAREQEERSRREGQEISISMGAARAGDHPDMSLQELIKLADDKMYKAKAEYYSSPERNRRRNR